MAKRSGYFEGGGYLVSWAFGHLFSLCDIEDYTGGDPSAKWSLEGLPCFPSEFRYKLKLGADKKADTGIERQFETIKSLCLRNDVDTIVNAGDSDREGEIIIRLCVMNTGALAMGNKRFTRLWLPDQTPETVGRALDEMKDENEYDNLANEGFARTYIDWLYGVNLTRYATLKCGTLLRVGRVIVPIVRAIYDRDMAIRNFVPDVYLAIASKEETKGEEIELVSREKFDKGKREDAEALCAKYNASEAKVISKKTKKETVNPGKLYSLSKLQSFLGKKYKMSMADSLAIVQDLYEKGFLTYPRTNSEYLATNEKDKIKKILANVKGLGYPVVFKDKKTIFDDSKIESHSALTPTYKIPKKEQLSEREMQVYQTVFRRFVSVFCEEECIAQKTEIVIDLGGYEQFTLKGITIIQQGFLKYDDTERKDKILPPLEKGDLVNIDFKPVEKQTSPPKHYTIETLNNYLKNPFREDKMALAEKEKSAEGSAEEETENDEEDYKAIFEGLELGTEATRTGIIDNARKSGYIELKKDVYTILKGGEYLIEQLSQMDISMDKYKTSVLGQALKRVFRGSITVNDAVKQACDEISEVFVKKNATPEEDTDTGFYGDEVGICPLCGKSVKKGRYSYECSGYKDGCTFRIPTTVCGRTVSITNARLLLSEGVTSEIQGFVSKKNGKSFGSRLVLDEDKKTIFEKRQPATRIINESAPTMLGAIVGQCPLCGKNVIRGRQDYGCMGYKDGCTFRIGGVICQREISVNEAQALLANGKTPKLFNFISKSGKPFNGKLKIDGDRAVFDFD